MEEGTIGEIYLRKSLGKRLQVKTFVDCTVARTCSILSCVIGPNLIVSFFAIVRPGVSSLPARYYALSLECSVSMNKQDHSKDFECFTKH